MVPLTKVKDYYEQGSRAEGVRTLREVKGCRYCV